MRSSTSLLLKILSTAAIASTAFTVGFCYGVKAEEGLGQRPSEQSSPSRLVIRHHRPLHTDSNGNAIGLVTRETAAGTITIAASLADRMEGFISDLVARGYRPKHVSCYSLSHSHVAHSLHFRGEACDFDQRGWGKTARAMYHVADLTAKWNLRNGCSFGDCGHVDSGRAVRRASKPHTQFAAGMN